MLNRCEKGRANEENSTRHGGCTATKRLYWCNSGQTNRILFQSVDDSYPRHRLTMPPARFESDAGTTPDRKIQSIKQQLREALPHLQEKYAVEQLYLHGSRLRGEARSGSDLDVLVDFEESEAGRRVSLLDFVALKQELEELLELEVDLGERTALRGPAGNYIQREAEPV